MAPALPPAQISPPLVAFDLGNYSSTTISDHGLTTVRSLVSRLPAGRDAFPSSLESPVLTIDGTKYHIGSRAQDYRGCRASVVGEKSDHARLLFLATVPDEVLATGDCDLVVTHHGYRNETTVTDLQLALSGQHHFRRAGKDHSLTVHGVTVAPESFGIWHLAYPHGRHSSYSIVIDLGGGSWVAGVLDHYGQPLEVTTDPKGGTVALAQRLATDDRLLAPLRKRGVSVPKVAAIMDGLASDNRYFGDPAITWDSWLGEYVDEWWADIKGQVINSFDDWKDRCDRIFVVGGGANFLRDRLRGSRTAFVPKNPHLAAIQGTFKHFRGGDS